MAPGGPGRPGGGLEGDAGRGGAAGGSTRGEGLASLLPFDFAAEFDALGVRVAGWAGEPERTVRAIEVRGNERAASATIRWSPASMSDASGPGHGGTNGLKIEDGAAVGPTHAADSLFLRRGAPSRRHAAHRQAVWARWRVHGPRQLSDMRIDDLRRDDAATRAVKVVGCPTSLAPWGITFVCSWRRGYDACRRKDPCA